MTLKKVWLSRASSNVISFSMTYMYIHGQKKKDLVEKKYF